MVFLNGKPFTALLRRVTALLILLPFFIISFFNQPIGDDFWSTDLVRRLGYWHAQGRLYDTVPPRWLALAMSCLSPLSFGNFFGYKVIPVVFILLFIMAMGGLFKTLSRGGDTRHDARGNTSRKGAYELAILFTAIFLSATPGIGDGLFWVSALIVFGTGLLLFICWINLLLMWYGGRRSGWVLAGLCLCIMGMAGCNEIITVVSMGVLAVLGGYRLIRGMGVDRVVWISFFLLALCVGFAACFKGVGNRYMLMQTVRSARFWYSAGFSVLVSGFCLFKAVTSPFCLAAMLAAYDPFVRWCRGVYVVRRELMDRPGYFVTAWVFILLVIPFIVLYLSGLHPPYRVVNMVFFFLLIGLVYFGTLLVNSRVLVNGRGWVKAGGRNIAIMVLLAAGFMVKNNVSIATRELVSGSAYQYDREMNDRWRRVMECGADSCVVPQLRHTSFILRYDPSDENDHHVNDYFRKEVIVR